MAINVRGDNSGPHPAEEIAKIHADLAARFPNAEITACNLSDMANAIAAVSRQAAGGDARRLATRGFTGCASDPLKVARYREVARLRERWIELGGLRVGSEADLQLLRHVLLEAEHTWGTDTKTWLDFDNYEPADLWRGCWIRRSTRWWSSAGLRNVRICWTGLRHCRRRCAKRRSLRFRALAPVWPVLSPQAIGDAAGKPIETEHFIVGDRRKDWCDYAVAEQGDGARMGKRQRIRWGCSLTRRFRTRIFSASWIAI